MKERNKGMGKKISKNEKYFKVDKLLKLLVIVRGINLKKRREYVNYYFGYKEERNKYLSANLNPLGKIF